MSFGAVRNYPLSQKVTSLRKNEGVTLDSDPIETTDSLGCPRTGPLLHTVGVSGSSPLAPTNATPDAARSEAERLFCFADRDDPDGLHANRRDYAAACVGGRCNCHARPRLLRFHWRTISQDFLAQLARDMLVANINSVSTDTAD